MAKEYQRKVLDRRVIDRYVEKGVMSASEQQSYLKSLPDETQNADWVHLDLHDAEISDASLDNSLNSESEDSL